MEFRWPTGIWLGARVEGLLPSCGTRHSWRISSGGGTSSEHGMSEGPWAFTHSYDFTVIEGYTRQ